MSFYPYTSPPYFGLRDYNCPGQIGLEKSPEEYIHRLVKVFREVKRVLRDDGTLWVVIGDSYAGSGKGGNTDMYARNVISRYRLSKGIPTPAGEGIKHKDLIGIPWMLAFALRNDGWYLRQACIWNKPNPMPESVKDRCTKSHEYVLLLSKSRRYFFDNEAIKEPTVSTNLKKFVDNGHDKQRGRMRRDSGFSGKYAERVAKEGVPTERNRRDVWTVATQPFVSAHFATFPPALIRPCILAGSRPGGIVLDPFLGAGTTGLVALEHSRRFIGVELNSEYVRMAQERLSLSN
ncbi:MAG: site-specific DNA-methyltransferase [Chitinispirillales bacterium]|nr:site-specific DNA-methyltransferase [Chitinispirillales bacterium]